MVEIWLPAFKIFIKFIYGQFDLRAFPGYENISRASLYIDSIFGFDLLLHNFCYVIYVNFFVIGPHLSSVRITLTKQDVFNEINKYMYLSHWDLDYSSVYVRKDNSHKYPKAHCSPLRRLTIVLNLRISPHWRFEDPV